MRIQTGRDNAVSVKVHYFGSKAINGNFLDCETHKREKLGTPNVICLAVNNINAKTNLNAPRRHTTDHKRRGWRERTPVQQNYKYQFCTTCTPYRTATNTQHTRGYGNTPPPKALCHLVQSLQFTRIHARFHDKKGCNT